MRSGYALPFSDDGYAILASAYFFTPVTLPSLP